MHHSGIGQPFYNNAMRVLGLNERDSLCPLSARTAWDAEGWNKPTGVGLGLEAHVGTCSFKMCVCAHNPVFFFFLKIYISGNMFYIFTVWEPLD